VPFSEQADTIAEVAGPSEEKELPQIHQSRHPDAQQVDLQKQYS